MSVKIMLVGETPLLTRALRLLDSFSSTEVVTSSQKGTELLGSMNLFRPDIVLYDVSYAGSDAHSETSLHGRDAQAAFNVNSGGASKVSLYCRMNDAWMWMISDASVFPGKGNATSDTEPFPVHAFGLSRLLGERGVRTLCPDATIVRVGWLYGPEIPDSPPMIAEGTRDGTRSVANVSSGIIGSPTFVQDAADILVANMIISTYSDFGMMVMKGKTVHLAPKRAIDWWGYLSDAYPKVAPTHIKASREIYLGVRNASLVPTQGWDILPNGLERFQAEIAGSPRPLDRAPDPLALPF